MARIEQGCIDIWVDEIVPCLKDNETGEIKETVVFKIESRKYLKKFQENNDKDSHAAYMHWACTAPHNNIHDTGYQKYSGVGGHLFAIVADKSMEWGYEGAMHGFAADQKLLEHYMSMFHQYQFFIDEEQARLLLEVYHYEWNET